MEKNRITPIKRAKKLFEGKNGGCTMLLLRLDLGHYWKFLEFYTHSQLILLYVFAYFRNFARRKTTEKPQTPTDMKQKLLFSLFALLTATMARADVEINETNFPDTNFRNWVLNQTYGKDSVLTNSEIAGIRSITVWNVGISSLKGIEFFTAITLLNCKTNQLTSLDVSKCTALEYLDCGFNKLTSLDISGCRLLDHLYCYENQLTEIDVSGHTALFQLNCYRNRLTSLNVSGCTTLKILYCHYNQLTSLDVSGCTELRTLYCFNNQLTSIKVSGCLVLGDLYCYGNKINEAEMGKLVDNLPTRYGSFRVIYGNNDQNVMNTFQVEDATAKGWRPQWYYEDNWQVYAGSEPSPDGIGLTIGSSPMNEGSWYDLSGRRVSGKFAKRGIYIKNGKKIATNLPLK